MANRSTTGMTGVPDLLAKMACLGEEASTKAGQSATRAAAMVTAKAIKEAAPVGDEDTSRTYTVNGGDETRTVDYGHLRDNIRVRKGKPRKEHVVVTTIDTGNAFWAKMVEFGTEKAGAHPFMGPAAEAAAPAATQAMATAMNKALDRIARKRGLA